MSRTQPSLTALSIRDLSDHLELVSRIARWHWNEWGGAESDTETRRQQRIAERSLSGEVPFTRIAFLDDALVGTLSVCWGDVDGAYADKGPWPTGVFVQGPARNLGVGRTLLIDVE